MFFKRCIFSSIREAEYNNSLLDDKKWVDDFKEDEDQLKKTAQHLIGTVDDPKFSESEVRENKRL